VLPKPGLGASTLLGLGVFKTLEFGESAMNRNGGSVERGG
jgi:hypothetical protein